MADDTTTDARPLDRRNGQRPHPLHRVGHQAAEVGLCPVVGCGVLRPTTELAQVEAGRERPALPGDDHDGRVGGVEPRRRLGDLGERGGPERVQLGGLGEGEPADSTVHRYLQRFER